jgi:UDP-2,3-diacylglucosamine pyrophosphatase LpxH
MLERVSKGPTRVRTLFISDVHLGTKGCQADKLLDFLRHYEAETVYLVGDIVDGWLLKSGWYWPQPHNDVVQKLLRQARKGARLFYIPGNHDEFLRDYYGTHFGGIEVLEDAIHVGPDGKRYLVIHGDLFDVVIRHARWLALLGNNAYDLAIWLNTYFNAIRRAFGLTYWSLSQWAKLKVKNAVNFIGEYEKALVTGAAAPRRRCDLRAYPSCRDPPPTRPVLHQLRRLGGKLHGSGRALRWSFEIVHWTSVGPKHDETDVAVAAVPTGSKYGRVCHPPRGSAERWPARPSRIPHLAVKCRYRQTRP